MNKTYQYRTEKPRQDRNKMIILQQEQKKIHKNTILLMRLFCENNFIIFYNKKYTPKIFPMQKFSDLRDEC